MTTALSNYLLGLQNKIFKLLPMREAYDMGVDNYVYRYVDNLKLNCVGATKVYPALIEEIRFLDVIATIATIADMKDKMPFSTFRSAIFRSTRLIHTLLEEELEREKQGGKCDE